MQSGKGAFGWRSWGESFYSEVFRVQIKVDFWELLLRFKRKRVERGGGHRNYMLSNTSLSRQVDQEAVSGGLLCRGT